MQDERFQSDSGQPTIEIFDIPIMEPMVTFTDLWITAVCLFALFKLIKLNKKGKCISISAGILGSWRWLHF